MSKPRFLFISFWVCAVFFVFSLSFILPTELGAIDSSSPFFQQNQGSSPGGSSSSQPIALPEETPKALPGFFPTFIRVLLALGITVVLFYLFILGLKIVWEKRGWKNEQVEGRPVKILNSTYLSPRKVIYLVEIGKRILILGAGEEEIHCLDVITDPEEISSLKQSNQEGFADMFKKVLQNQESSKENVQQIMAEGNRAVSFYLEKFRKASKKIEKPVNQDLEQNK